MKKMFFLMPLASLIVAGCLTQTTPKNQTPPVNTNQSNNQNGAAMPNPASAYCEEQGGRLEIRTADDGSQSGFCVFTDGSECEEWSYFRDECEPANTENISGEIKTLFIEKYNKSQDEVRVTIDQQTESYARGGVKFGRDGIGEGGIFLAAKNNGEWELVFDGNGMIPCSLLAAHSFPEGMAPDCVDLEN